MTSTITPSVSTLAAELETQLQNAEEAVKSAFEVAGELTRQLTELEDKLLEAGEPAALVGAAQRAASTVLSEVSGGPDDPTFTYAVKDAAEVKELVRLAAEQLH